METKTVHEGDKHHVFIAEFEGRYLGFYRIRESGLISVYHSTNMAFGQIVKTEEQAIKLLMEYV